MKNEPESKAMDDQTALNNLLAAAAAETLGTIATTTARNSQPVTHYNAGMLCTKFATSSKLGLL